MDQDNDDQLSSQVTEEEDLFMDDPSFDEETEALAQEAVAQQQENDADDNSTSLHTRLAGPSAFKAGMESVDKEYVNRVIFEASKGSAFFENERKRDEALTKRLDEMIRQYDKIKDMDLSFETKLVDHKINEMDTGRDLTQCICHVDMDAFYASVEELDDPSLKEIPMAVGGMHMLCTSNYKARQFGVRSAMPGYLALKLCPQLKIIPLHFPKYRAASAKVRAIFAKYDPSFLPMSLDEAYLNLTNYLSTSELTPEQLVQQIRDEIQQETQLTASAGIAANRMLAKICSDFNKPNGQYFLPMEREAIMKFTSNLSIRKVSGVGRVTERVLQTLDVKTCGDILHRRAILYRLLSPISFQFMLKCYLGLGSTNFNLESDRKSISVERTFSALSKPDDLYRKVDELAELLAVDLGRNQIQGGKTVGIKLKLTSFDVRVRSKTYPSYISKKEDIARIVKELVQKELPVSIRLMGIRLSSLPPKVDDDHGVKKYFKKRKNTDAGEEQPRKISTVPSSPVSVLTSTSVTPDTHLTASIAANENAPSIVAVTCPICSRSLALDNHQFNQHLDECLNKVTVKAILQQQQQNQSPPQDQTQGRSLLDYYR